MMTTTGDELEMAARSWVVQQMSCGKYRVLAEAGSLTPELVDGLIRARANQLRDDQNLIMFWTNFERSVENGNTR